MVSHSRIALQSRCSLINTINTERGAQHLNSAPIITSFTHLHTGISHWERNEGILTSGDEVNS